MVTTQWENNLKKRLHDFLQLTYDESVQKAKIEEAKKKKFTHDDKYYRSKAYNEVGEHVLAEFDVELEFCETQEQNDIWEYYRVHTSSIRTNKNIGRLIRILVKHKQSDKYIGILSLSSDIYACAARDTYIGLPKEDKNQKLVYVMNITTCVGLQPFSYNFNVGKLLVGLCFSKEVSDKIKEKYSHEIACITTFSINGKSIQYDRLPYLKFVGMTKGYAMTNIPDALYKSCIRYLTHIKDYKTLGYDNRMYKMKKVLSYLDICPDDAQKRGIYVGFTSPDSKAFLEGKADSFEVCSQTCQEICAWWKKRWAQQRFQHLSSQGRLRYKPEFHNAWNIINNERVQKSVAKKKELIGEEEYNKQNREYMMTYRYEEIQVTRPPKHAEINLKWLGGFFDGDGCVEYINGYPRISIGQCNPDPLIRLYHKYGGKLRATKNTGENSRKIFKWGLVGQQTRAFAEDVAPHAILESKRLSLCLTDPLQIASHTKMYTDPTLQERINNEYTAGIFDAEGEVSLRKGSNMKYASYCIRITQQSCLLLLNHIMLFLGYGNVGSARFSTYSKDNIKDFLTRTSPYLVVKAAQAKVLKDYLDGNKPLEEGCEQIHAEKHRIYNVEDYITKTIKTEKKIVQKKKFDDPQESSAYNHRLNLKHGTTLAKHSKRKVTDDQIIEMRKLHEEGMMITTIAQRFGISRQYASDIIHKKMVTMEELGDGAQLQNNLDMKIKDKDLMEQSKISKMDWGIMKSALAKRKVQPIIILTVMDMKLKNKDMLLTQILKKVKEDDENLTMDMVKNYTKGKINMFELEFPVGDYTWDMFTTMKETLQST